MSNEYYGAPSTPISDFLAHYGVLGMKWGIRRAAKKGTNYEYKSHATKKYEKAAAKLAAKAEKKGSEKLAAKSKVMANRAKRSKEIDRGEEEYARGLSTKNAIGLALLGGTDRMKAYAQNRAMSKQKGKDATGDKVVAGLESGFGTFHSRRRKAGYIRQDEKKNGFNANAHNLGERIRKGAGRVFDPAAQEFNKNRKKRR